MLTATENVRVNKFTKNMSPKTARAIKNLFIITKSGGSKSIDELISAAHRNERVSNGVIGALRQYGLVTLRGLIPEDIRNAIREAVSKRYLMIKGPKTPAPKPDALYLNYE